MISPRKKQLQRWLGLDKVWEMQPWTVEQKIQGTSSHGVHIKAVFRPGFSDRISTEDGSATPVQELMLTDVEVRSLGRLSQHWCSWRVRGGG